LIARSMLFPGRAMTLHTISALVRRRRSRCADRAVHHAALDDDRAGHVALIHHDALDDDAHALLSRTSLTSSRSLHTSQTH